MTVSLNDSITSPYIDRRDAKTRTWRRRSIFDVMQVRCLHLRRICLLSAKWPQLLGNRRTNSYKSAGTVLSGGCHGQSMHGKINPNMTGAVLFAFETCRDYGP